MVALTSTRSRTEDPLPPLPPLVRTRDGQEIIPTEGLWSLRKQGTRGGPIHLNWSDFQSLSPRAVHLAKLILSMRAGDRASLTTRNDLHALRRFDRWLDVPGFNWTDLTLTLAED